MKHTASLPVRDGRRRAALLALLLAAPVTAQQQPAPAKAAPPVQSYVSHHEGRFNGVTVSYTATAADTVLENRDGQPAATIFSFSYTRDDVEDPTARPVVFIFNGGPGSSSLWLHMSGLGPKRIHFGDGPGANTAPPFDVVDSDISILDAADLVFIDPVGTGFSRLLPAGKAEDYYGFNEDARSVAKFIELWIAAHGRWNSPRYVMGESYGSMRAAALARELTDGSSDETRLGLNGIILLGQAMAITETNPDPDNDMSPPLYLPSMAATAWYHGKVDKSGHTFEQFLEQARTFAREDYVSALFAGANLGADERASIARRLAEFTGITAGVWLQHDLRLTRIEFAAELLRDQGIAIGLYDARFEQPLPAGDTVRADPFTSQVAPPFTAAFLGYIYGDLGIPPTENYRVSAPVFARWNWDTGAGGTSRFFYNVAPLIADGMRKNPQLRVLVGCGYYDMTTPFYSAEHTISHSGMPLDRVEFTYYHAGHMPHVGDDNARKLAGDVRRFVTESR